MPIYHVVAIVPNHKWSMALEIRKCIIRKSLLNFRLDGKSFKESHYKPVLHCIKDALHGLWSVDTFLYFSRSMSELVCISR